MYVDTPTQCATIHGATTRGGPETSSDSATALPCCRWHKQRDAQGIVKMICIIMKTLVHFMLRIN